MVSYKALNTPRKSIISNIWHTIWNFDAGEWFTPRKSIIFNICHAIWNNIACFFRSVRNKCGFIFIKQNLAFIYKGFWLIMQVTIPPEKRITIHINYATWDYNFSKWRASRKSTISNIYHTIWNIDFSEWFTIIKSFISNICHTIWNIDVGEWRTSRESIISWLSVLYVLNGRKVTVWILYRYEMAKI